MAMNVNIHAYIYIYTYIYTRADLFPGQHEANCASTMPFFRGAWYCVSETRRDGANVWRARKCVNSLKRQAHGATPGGSSQQVARNRGSARRAVAGVAIADAASCGLAVVTE